MSTEVRETGPVRVETGRSPLPWRSHCDAPRTRRGGLRLALVITPNGRTSIDVTGSGETFEQDVANAAFIVRAVNAHEALLSAAMHGAIAIEEVIEDIETFAEPDAEARKDLPEWRRVLTEVRAAITLATEGR